MALEGATFHVRVNAVAAGLTDSSEVKGQTALKERVAQLS